MFAMQWLVYFVNNKKGTSLHSSMFMSTIMFILSFKCTIMETACECVTGLPFPGPQVCYSLKINNNKNGQKNATY